MLSPAGLELIAWRASLAGVVLACLLWGRSTEKVGAVMLIAADVLSLLLQERSPWTRVDVGLTGVDVGLFIALTLLALSGRRVWTIFAAGFQGSATCMHVARLVAPSVLPISYWLAAVIWSYLVLACLAMGVWVLNASVKSVEASPSTR